MFVMGPTPTHRLKIVHKTGYLVEKLIPEFWPERGFVTCFMPQRITAGIDVSVDEEKDETPPWPPGHPCQVAKQKETAKKDEHVFESLTIRLLTEFLEILFVDVASMPFF